MEIIEIEQKSLKISFDEQKNDVEHFSNVQNEFSNSLVTVIETVGKLNEKLDRVVQTTDHRFSEVERIAEKRNTEYNEKCSSFKNEVEERHQTSQGFYSKMSLELERFSANTDKKYETVQQDLTDLLSENTMLLKSLLLAKVMSFASLTLSVVLLIFILTGV